MTPADVARRRLAILEQVAAITPATPPQGIDVAALQALLARRQELFATWPPEDPPEEEAETRAIMARVRALAEEILARDKALTVVLADAQRRVVRIMRRQGTEGEGRRGAVNKVI